ncbi:nucleoside diphosphate kinase regulator [Acinetobacter sp. B51(2017)]|uniref:nucleoside diphosphate kinase regulator n=1 Tax=Acinetobacter sp. B51(2017) TaxID=2060938 RepID=UPI000F08AE8E|nr:nucleoside diphosphate kinase regulator [Acinetobacter sp. B51(2017)]
MSNKPQIIISEQDLNRLETMLEHQQQLSPTMQHLEDELARATVVAPQQVPANVVSMNARVLITIGDAPEPTEVVLVYPHDFKGEKNQVNVIAPIGAAILGLSEGQTIQWPQPDGHMMQVKIEKVLFQPEREGNFL